MIQELTEGHGQGYRRRRSIDNGWWPVILLLHLCLRRNGHGRCCRLLSFGCSSFDDKATDGQLCREVTPRNEILVSGKLTQTAQVSFSLSSILSRHGGGKLLVRSPIQSTAGHGRPAACANMIFGNQLRTDKMYEANERHAVHDSRVSVRYRPRVHVAEVYRPPSRSPAFHPASMKPSTRTRGWMDLHESIISPDVSQGNRASALKDNEFGSGESNIAKRAVSGRCTPIDESLSLRSSTIMCNRLA